MVRWSRSRKRYERQGILAEEAAIQQAEEQCLADEDVRLRRRDRDRERRAQQDVAFQARMAGQIRRLFPGCPENRATAIAQHAALRGSGRVGRSAAARALDEKAITLAVVASVRHEDTDYDPLLMSGTPGSSPAIRSGRPSTGCSAPGPDKAPAERLFGCRGHSGQPRVSAMARLTLRAVEQPDGRYRVSVTPATPGVDIHRAYSVPEVHSLAERMHAEVRWVSARDEHVRSAGAGRRGRAERPKEEPPGPPGRAAAGPQESRSRHEGSSAPWGGDYAAPDTVAPSDDPWGGTLSAGNED